MRGTNVSLGVRAALAIFSVTLFATTPWAASEKKLHNFGNGSDGAYPQGALISDGAGGFYGTTPGGGVYGGGTVFNSAQGGGWWSGTCLTWVIPMEYLRKAT